jgi:hypothetical protein
LVSALECRINIGYRPLMRGLFRRSLVLLLISSFAASGVAARQCDAAHHSTAASGATQQALVDHEHHHHAAHGGSQALGAGGAMVHQHGSNGGGALADDHMCAKCCGLCTLVMAVTVDARVAVIFSASSASFSDKPEHRVGATVKVDPGIPKLIV